MDMLEHYNLDFFHANGFTRKECPSCRMFFWTQDPSRERCGDPPCVEYTFIGKPVAKAKLDLTAMREKYLSFLEKRGHTRVRRQPVVARWRDDIYLNIASISNYQPHVTGGKIPPPANPLAVSQPCIRLNDVDSVGRSGRHLTCFEMMAHHCFNYPDGHPFKKVNATGQTYFKNRTVELCQGFLVELGIDPLSVTYKENPWSGGGNAGPAFEVMTHGLEVATLVFMQWEADPNGAIDVKREKFREMGLKIVDTGYGLERFVWASQGTPTIYESVFPDTIEFLAKSADLSFRKDPEFAKVLAEVAKLSCIMSVDTGTKVMALRKEVADRVTARGFPITAEELARRLAPLEAVYAVADHTRCLTFMLGDGVVPSNVRAGYLARLLIRKSLRLLQEARIDVPLYDVFATHLERMKGDYPEIWEMRDTIRDVLDVETERFRETLERGRRLVQREAKGAGGKLSTERLIQLYDSHGMPPEVVQEAAAEVGARVDVPDDFYQRVAQLHGKEEQLKATERAPPKLPPTVLKFYDEPRAREFNATVLWVEKDGDGSHKVILDRTLFYPEGGGQPADHGFLFVKDDSHRVVDVQKWGDLVVHTIDGPAKVGDTVRGHVDWGRRQALTMNHSATHIVAGSARAVLGRHVWQTGAQKGTARSRLDITHYKRVTDEELREMESLANVIVLDGRAIEKVWLDRNEAEKKFGWVLYQGGVPAGDKIRVVRIPEFDVQACAGTHVGTTNEMGVIKIFKSERIQDGVERIEFAAGLSALREVQQRDDLLASTAEAFGVPVEELPKTAKRFFEEWKAYRKEAEHLRAKVATASIPMLLSEAQTVGRVKLVVARLDLGLDELVKAAGDLAKTPGVVAVLAGASDGKAGVVVARSQDLTLDVRDAVKAGGEKLGGGGGGKPDMARAGGPDPAKVDEALAAAANAVRATLR